MTLPKDTTIRSYVTKEWEPVIVKKDVLSIEVSSLSREMDEKFNAGSLGLNEPASAGGFGYVVGDSGTIDIHYAGKIKAAGLTTGLLAQNIQESLKPYLKEPLVRVRILSRRITVMGEVSAPKIIYMQNEPMTIVDAIVSSGDLKETADRQRIMVIRDSSDVKLVKHLNMEKHDFIASEWFYVQPNDIVYVMPKGEKQNKEERLRTLQTTLSLAATALSLIVILARF